MNFDEYLVSKKIDGAAFKKAEPSLFEDWKNEFEQMHVNSFTVHKLNLINPIRRKYQLKDSVTTTQNQDAATSNNPPGSAPRVARPVFKPKIN